MHCRAPSPLGSRVFAVRSGRFHLRVIYCSWSLSCTGIVNPSENYILQYIAACLNQACPRVGYVLHCLCYCRHTDKAKQTPEACTERIHGTGDSAAPGGWPVRSGTCVRVRHNITSWLLDSTFQPAREYVLAHQTNNTPGSIRKQRRRNNDTSSVASTAAHRFCLVGLTRLSSQSQVQTAPQREQVSCRARRLLPRWCRFSPPTSNNHCRFRTAIRNQKSIYAALEWSLPWLPGARGRTRASRSLQCGRRRGRAGRSGGRCWGK